MGTLSNRCHGGVARVAVLSLAALHVGLALGVTHELDAHRLEAAARLPAAFHHHDFSLAQQAPDLRRSIVDECLACHLSRLVPKLVAPAVVPGARPEAWADGMGASPVAPRRISPSPHIPRGPPTPSV